MNLPFFIAKRYIFSKKSRNAINVITGITVLAIAVISFSLVIILSALNGFESLLKNLYSDFDPDLKIEVVEGKTFTLDHLKEAKLNKISGIAGIYECIEENAVVMHKENKVIATLKGIDTLSLKASGIEKYIAAGSMDLIVRGKPMAILGAGIDQKLTSDVSNPYTILTMYVPRKGDYSINDLDGVQEMRIHPGGVLLMDQIINDKYVIVPLSFAREFFEYKKEVSYLEIQLDSLSDKEEIQEQIIALMGEEFTVKNRIEQQSSIFTMFKKEKRSTFAILVLIMIIATFNLIGALTMMVLEKKKDLGTFKSLGGTPKLIRKIYYFEGITISLLGAILGMILGVALVLIQTKYHIMTLENSIIDFYPVHLQWKDLVIILFVTVLLGFLTSIYPAKMAAREIES